MGFALQSFSPPAQPYLVSKVSPLMSFPRPLSSTTKTAATADPPKNIVGTTELAIREALRTSVASRGLLRA